MFLSGNGNSILVYDPRFLLSQVVFVCEKVAATFGVFGLTQSHPPTWLAGWLVGWLTAVYYSYSADTTLPRF